MKEIIAAFVLMIWMGAAMSLDAALDQRSKEANCEHGFGVYLSAYIAAPALITAAILAEHGGGKPEKHYGCIE